MKKLLITAIAIVGVVFALEACSSDSAKDDLTLAGSKWVSEQEWNGIKGTETLQFAETQVFVTARSNDGAIDQTVRGTYTYNHPHIVLLFTSGENSGSLEMERKGNTIEYIRDGITYVYTKK